MVDAPVGPSAPPTHTGHPVDQVVMREIDNLNLFWGSHMVAFEYGADQPEAMHNAIANHDGYIYYDPMFLEMLDAKRYSYAPSQMVLAHEVGHELQFAYNTFAGGGIRDELGADCLAGYFVGWLACSMSLSDDDVMADFDSMCESGDNDAEIPWWSPQAHGTCEQRTRAFEQGAQAYGSGAEPLGACTF